MTLPDIVQNYGLVASAQVQVFQPNQVALVFDAVDNRLAVGDPRENWRNEAGGADPRVVKFFHRRDSPLDTDSLLHIVLKVLIQRVNGKAHPCVRKRPDQVHIAQHQVGLGLDTQLYVDALQLFQQGPSAPVRLLLRQVWIGDGAEE